LSYAQNLNSALDEIRRTLLKKHHDYGSGNLLRRGEVGILIRCEDKLARISNLLDNTAKVEDENILATWEDLAGYAIQAILMRKGLLAEEIAASTRDKLFTELYDNLFEFGACPKCRAGDTYVNLFNGHVLFQCRTCGFSHEEDIDPFINYDTPWFYRCLVNRALSDVGK